MKKGTEIGIRPIKCENKEGSDKLRDVHMRINAILYINAGKYIDPKLANTMYKDLCAIGVELDELEVPERAREKKKELLGKLRTVCMALKDYRKQPMTADDVPLMQKALGFFIHNYIEAKQKDDITPQQVLDLLVESRRLWDAYLPFAESLRTDTFIKVNTELVNWFERYSIRTFD